MSALTAKSGYLVPLKLSTTSPGTVVSASRGVVYVVITTENNIIRGINSPSDMIGFPVEERSSWSADCGNASNLFDGNQSTTVSGLLSSGNVLTVDMQTIHMVTGLHFYSYNLTNLSIEYSTDGTEWNAGGTVASDENHYTGSSWDAGDYYVAIANYVEARYFRFSFGFSTWYTNLYEFEIYQIESTDPMVYAMAGDNNVLNGKITHKAGSSACDLEASFKAYATISSPYGYQVQVTADDSLVETYNNSHGTSYQALPSENLQLENDLLAIAGGENISSGEVKVSLCGNLSALTNANGYLVPLKLSTDSGAAVSDKYGVVYVVLTVENSMIQAIESADEIKGTLVADRSAWSADCDSASSLFDDDEWSWSEFKQTGNVFTVDLSQPVNLTGLYFCGSLFKNLTIEYSADGNTWQSAGTVSDEYVFERESSWDPGYYYVALATSIEARYLRFSFDFDSNEWYYEIYEFNVFQSGN